MGGDVDEGSFFDVEQIAERLNVAPHTVRRWLREGKLVGHQFGGDKTGWRVSEKALGEFIERSRKGDESP